MQQLIEVETAAYIETLSPACRELHDTYLESTLHVSSEWYLSYLTAARDAGEIVFTVDYALEPDNVAWIYVTSRAYGFIPFVGPRQLNVFIDPFEP